EQLDRFAEAVEKLARATATLERTLGADNPETAEIRRYWASALDRVGRTDEAEAEMERAVAALEKTLGPKHPTVARSQGDLAAFYARHGREGEAEPLLRRCIASLHGGGSREEGDCLRMLGNLLSDAPGRAAEAATSLEEAVAILGQGDPKDPFLLIALATLGHARVQLGELSAGERVLRDAIARLEAVYGPEGDQLRRPLFWLGEVELARGQPGEAVVTLRRGLAVAEKHRGAESTAAAKAAETLARALAAAGGGENLAEAARLVERATAIYRGANASPERLASLADLAKVIERAASRPPGGVS
ncbi:MAG: tetratricopeptide repeat protein, partial [Thermoanaerobaculia bacterium]